jgi:hypothetical protein
MNTHRFQQLVIGIFLSMAFLLPQKYVYAQGSNFVDIPLETLHDGQPIELRGLISSQTLNIPIPASWSLGKQTWLEIQFRRSPLLDLARSSVTVSVNGLQVNSYRLQEVTEMRQRILIPADRFTQGNNTLTIVGTLYLPDDPQTNCQNWDDPSRWLLIEPGGILHLSFSRRELPVDLSSFPQILIEPLEKYQPAPSRKQTLIVLPENRTQDDLTALSTLSYVLGNSADATYDWHPEIVTGRQLSANMIANRNIIFIGVIPQEFQDQASNKDHITLFPSPWGVGNVAMIIGDQNRGDGFSPASTFSDPTRSLLLHGNVAYIDQHSPPARQPFQNNITFEDLGYLDRTVRGIGQQNLIYSLYIPYDIEPILVKFHLGLVHSPDLDLLTSSFTVYLNGFSIAGILPTDRSSDGKPIAIGLPAKRFRRGINFIRVAFDLHVPHSSCDRALETIWATVLNSSTLEITHRNRVPTPSLKHFPLPFSDYSGFAFVIPDQYNQKDLDYVSRLSFLIGSSAYPPSRPPEVITATHFSQKQTEYLNAILVGLPSENSITRNTNDLLPQPFKADENSLQEGYGVYLPTSDKDASLGLMQVIPSPWVKGGTVLVLTGNDRQGLEWAWDTILNPALQTSFGGNVMVVGSANRSQALGGVLAQQNPQILFQQIADASNIPIIGPMLQRSGQAFVLPNLVAIGTSLFLVICTLWAIAVRRNRKTPDSGNQTEEG